MTETDQSRRTFLTLLGAGGAAGLAGCTGGDESSGGTDDGGDTLQERATIGLGSDPTSSFWAMYGGVGPYRTRVLEPLIWVNPDFTLKPWLATQWEQTGDTMWEFRIREGVSFHNGDPLTAETVVFSIEKLLREFPQAQYTWLFAVEEDTDPPVPKVRAIDDRTVEFTTSKPFPAFAAGIAHNMVAIQHPETDGDTNTVVATGPYQVESVSSGQHVKVSRFDEYWNGTATTPKLTYRPIADPNTRYLALKNHDIDVAFNPPRSKFDAIKNAKNMTVLKQVAPRAGIINCNLQRSPTDDVKLRRALNYAVSQEAIVDSILNGIGKPAKGPIAPIIGWSAHDDLPAYTQDTETARTLVKESSYDGEPIQLLMTNNPQANWAPSNGQELAEVVQHAAKEIGVTIEINASEYSAFTDAWANQEGHLYLFEWGTKSGAADYIMFKYHSRENEHHSPSDEFDAAVEQGEAATSMEAKKEAYGRAQQLLMEQGVVLPLYYKEYIVGIRTDIEGLELHPLSQMTSWEGLKHHTA